MCEFCKTDMFERVGICQSLNTIVLLAGNLYPADTIKFKLCPICGEELQTKEE